MIVNWLNLVGLSLFLKSVSISPAFEKRHSDGTDIAVIDKSDLATLDSAGKDLW